MSKLIPLFIDDEEEEEHRLETVSRCSPLSSRLTVLLWRMMLNKLLAFYLARFFFFYIHCSSVPRTLFFITVIEACDHRSSVLAFSCFVLEPVCLGVAVRGRMAGLNYLCPYCFSCPGRIVCAFSFMCRSQWLGHLQLLTTMHCASVLGSGVWFAGGLGKTQGGR